MNLPFLPTNTGIHMLCISWEADQILPDKIWNGEMVKRWSGEVVKWWNGEMVKWWNGEVVKWWSGEVRIWVMDKSGIWVKGWCLLIYFFHCSWVFKWCVSVRLLNGLFEQLFHPFTQSPTQEYTFYFIFFYKCNRLQMVLIYYISLLHMNTLVRFDYTLYFLSMSIQGI